MESIAVEIFDTIISFLPTIYSSHYWKDDEDAVQFSCLLSLCLTSKSIYAMTKRHLYTHFTMVGDEHDGRLRQFLHRILEYPSHALAVRHATYEINFECLCGYGGVPDDLTEWAAAMPVFLNALEKFPQLLADEEFMGHLSYGCPEAEIVLLLCAAPNLQTLMIKFPCHDGFSGFLEDALKLAVYGHSGAGDGDKAQQNSPRILPKLHRLMCHADQDPSTRTFDMEPLLPLLELPSMRIFDSTSAWATTKSCMTSWAGYTTHLQSVILDFSWFYNEDLICSLLRACPLLKEFRISYDARCDHEYNLNEVKEALLCCKDTLEVLDWDYGEQNETSLAPLTEFTALKSIRVNFNLMIPSQSETSTGESRGIEDLLNWFPPSIEDISLKWGFSYDDNEDKDAEKLKRIAQKCHERYPMLRRFIILNYYGAEALYAKDDCRALEDIFGKLGIQFEDWL